MGAGGKVSYVWDLGVRQLDGQPLVGVEVVLEAPGTKARVRPQAREQDRVDGLSRGEGAPDDACVGQG